MSAFASSIIRHVHVNHLLHFRFHPQFVCRHLSIYSSSSSSSSNRRPKSNDAVDDPQSFLRYVRDQCKLGFSSAEIPVKLFHQLNSLSPRPSVIMFNQLLTAMTKIKPNPPFSTILTLSNQLELFGLRPDSHSVSIVAKCYCRLGHVDFGFSILGKLIKLGYPPHIVIVTTLLDGIIASDNVVKARAFFKSMVKNGLQPDVFTYNTLLDAYCLRGEMEEAENLVGLMVKNGTMPNVRTFNRLINGYCKAKQIDKAMVTLEGMCIEGTYASPDVFTYSTLIDALCKDNRLQLALQQLESMKHRGVAPNIVTYNSLLDGLLKHAEIDRAMSLRREMENNAVVPCIFTYTIIINGLFEAGQHAEAAEWFSNLVAKGLQPDVAMYNLMIKLLCRKGLFGDVIAILKRMEDTGCSPNERTYNTISRGFLFANDVAKALEFLSMLTSQGFATNANTASLFMGLLSSPNVGDTDKTLLQNYFLGHHA